MTWAHAGQYGAQGVGDSNGRPVPGQPVTVYQADGTTLATLYSDRSKNTTLGNPTAADANGNLTVWLDPGQYVLVTTINGRRTAEPIVVPPDPADLGQPLLAALTDVSLGSPADGQVLTYNAGSGLWVPTAPGGSGEIDYKENVTGTAQVLSATAGNFSAITDVTNCSGLTVPARASAVWVEGKVTATQTTAAAAGGLALFIYETTGTATIVEAITLPLPTSIDARGNSLTVTARLRLPSVASTRTFKLAARVGAVAGGNSATVSIANVATAESYLTARAA